MRRVLVLGASRCGKSTLIKALLPEGLDRGEAWAGTGATCGCYVQVLPVEVEPGQTHYVELLEVGGDESYREAARLAYFSLPVDGLLVVVDDSLPVEVSFSSAQAALQEYARYRGVCALRYMAAAEAAAAARRSVGEPAAEVSAAEAVAAFDDGKGDGGANDVGVEGESDALPPGVVTAVVDYVAHLPILVLCNKRDVAQQALPACRRVGEATMVEKLGEMGRAAGGGVTSPPLQRQMTRGSLSFANWDLDVCKREVDAGAVTLSMPLQIVHAAPPWYYHWLLHMFCPCARRTPKTAVFVPVDCATAIASERRIPHAAFNAFVRRVVDSKRGTHATRDTASTPVRTSSSASAYSVAARMNPTAAAPDSDGTTIPPTMKVGDFLNSRVSPVDDDAIGVRGAGRRSGGIGGGSGSGGGGGGGGVGSGGVATGFRSPDATDLRERRR